MLGSILLTALAVGLPAVSQPTVLHAIPTGTVATAATAPAPGGVRGAAQQEEEQVKVDLNKASSLELQRVPGIGPAMAQRILDWREQHGPFQRVEDLLNVRGIGEKTLEKLRPFFFVESSGASIHR